MGALYGCLSCGWLGAVVAWQADVSVRQGAQQVGVHSLWCILVFLKSIYQTTYKFVVCQLNYKTTGTGTSAS